MYEEYLRTSQLVDPFVRVARGEGRALSGFVRAFWSARSAPPRILRASSRSLSPLVCQHANVCVALCECNCWFAVADFIQYQYFISRKLFVTIHHHILFNPQSH